MLGRFGPDLLTSQIFDLIAFFSSSSESLWKKRNCAVVRRKFIICTTCDWFWSRSPSFKWWSCNKHTFSPSEDTKATGPLEKLMPVIIQESHAKSTFNKPFLRPHKNLLQSALTIFSERQALFPQCTLGTVCVQTSWPCKARFRAPVKT